MCVDVLVTFGNKTCLICLENNKTLQNHVEPCAVARNSAEPYRMVRDCAGCCGTSLEPCRTVQGCTEPCEFMHNGEEPCGTGGRSPYPAKFLGQPSAARSDTINLFQTNEIQ